MATKVPLEELFTPGKSGLSDFVGTVTAARFDIHEFERDDGDVDISTQLYLDITPDEESGLDFVLEDRWYGCSKDWEVTNKGGSTEHPTLRSSSRIRPRCGVCSTR